MAKRKVTEKQLANIKQHQFPKGVSGNPKGRPKGARSFKAVIEDILNEVAVLDLEEKNPMQIAAIESVFGAPVNYQNLMVLKQILKACQGDTYAFLALMERVEGKPLQKTENEHKVAKIADEIQKARARLTEADDD